MLLRNKIKKQEAENNDGKAVTDKPKVTAIIIATEPTELLQSDGAANYKTVEGTSLLYVSNSTNEIFKDINGQKTFVLIAGRWYNAPSLKGPWSFVDADKLPADFAKIPAGSDKDGVLASVAGTDEASEAMIDAEIPQTAKVERKTATVKVEYDGEPQFTRIEGTSLQVAENANLTVMIDPAGKYFALDNGVIGHVKKIYSDNKFSLKVIDEFGQNKIVKTVLFSTIESLEIGVVTMIT